MRKKNVLNVGLLALAVLGGAMTAPQNVSASDTTDNPTCLYTKPDWCLKVSDPDSQGCLHCLIIKVGHEGSGGSSGSPTCKHDHAGGQSKNKSDCFGYADSCNLTVYGDREESYGCRHTLTMYVIGEYGQQSYDCVGSCTGSINCLPNQSINNSQQSQNLNPQNNTNTASNPVPPDNTPCPTISGIPTERCPHTGRCVTDRNDTNVCRPSTSNGTPTSQESAQPSYQQPINPKKDTGFIAPLPPAAYTCAGGGRCDGVPVTGMPDELVCGGDLRLWKCTAGGWQFAGTTCECR